MVHQFSAGIRHRLRYARPRSHRVSAVGFVAQKYSGQYILQVKDCVNDPAPRSIVQDIASHVSYAASDH